VANPENENSKIENLKMKNLGERSVGLPNLVKRGVYPLQNDMIFK